MYGTGVRVSARTRAHTIDCISTATKWAKTEIRPDTNIVKEQMIVGRRDKHE